MFRYYMLGGVTVARSRLFASYRDAMLSAVYAVVECLSQSGRPTVSKRLNVGSHK